MPYAPTFEITPRLLSLCEEVARLGQSIQDSSIELPWVPQLQKDMRMRNAHATTAIEGNPLTLPEVRALAEGSPPRNAVSRSKREVLNYFAGLRYLEDHCREIPVREAHVLELHRILGHNVMDAGREGEYRFINVSVGPYNPPAHGQIPQLMADLLAWWNESSASLSPVITSAVVHYRFEAIHPFGDVNGRAGRALAMWELYRRGFDRHRIFAVDEYYWEDRPAYYSALAQVSSANEDLTQWLEYSATGLVQTLSREWQRIRAIDIETGVPLVLRPKQERLLELLRDTGSMTPAQIWEALGVSRQGAMNLINPLLEAGLVEKLGTKKTGRYILKSPRGTRA